MSTRRNVFTRIFLSGSVAATSRVVADFLMRVSVGPSWFHVTQDLVTGITFTERYPYDTATFAAASTVRAAADSVGVNAGVDVAVKLSKNIGIGGLVRYSHTSVEFPLPGAATSPKSDAGGIQAGGGIRLYF